tara:strand:- start:121 stop:438 length:318 start_codon:yes stop_codon:yes gene_type:complete
MAIKKSEVVSSSKKTAASSIKKKESASKDHKHLALEAELSSLKKEISELKSIVARQSDELKSMAASKAPQLPSGIQEKDVTALLRSLVVKHINYSSFRAYFKSLK